MYREMDMETRGKQVQELARQLDVLESYTVGPFVLGKDISHADAALFPTLVKPTWPQMPCMFQKHVQHGSCWLS